MSRKITSLRKLQAKITTLYHKTKSLKILKVPINRNVSNQIDCLLILKPMTLLNKDLYVPQLLEKKTKFYDINALTLKSTTLV